MNSISGTPRTDEIEFRHKLDAPYRQMVEHAREIELANVALRHALDCIVWRIDEEEFIPTEFIEMAREALKMAPINRNAD